MRRMRRLLNSIPFNILYLQRVKHLVQVLICNVALYGVNNKMYKTSHIWHSIYSTRYVKRGTIPDSLTTWTITNCGLVRYHNHGWPWQNGTITTLPHASSGTTDVQHNSTYITKCTTQHYIMYNTSAHNYINSHVINRWYNTTGTILWYYIVQCQGWFQLYRLGKPRPHTTVTLPSTTPCTASENIHQ